MEQGEASIWEKIPATMIKRVAATLALQRQFSLGSFYTTEEAELNLQGEHADIVRDLAVGHASNSPHSGRQSLHQSLKEEKSSGKQSKNRLKEKSETKPSEKADSKGFVLKQYDSGKSPSGIPYAKLYVVDQEAVTVD